MKFDVSFGCMTVVVGGGGLAKRRCTWCCDDVVLVFNIAGVVTRNRLTRVSCASIAAVPVCLPLLPVYNKEVNTRAITKRTFRGVCRPTGVPLLARRVPWPTIEKPSKTIKSLKQTRTVSSAFINPLALKITRRV